MVSIMRVIRAQDELIGALCKRDRHNRRDLLACAVVAPKCTLELASAREFVPALGHQGHRNTLTQCMMSVYAILKY